MAAVLTHAYNLKATSSVYRGPAAFISEVEEIIMLLLLLLIRDRSGLNALPRVTDD